MKFAIASLLLGLLASAQQPAQPDQAAPSVAAPPALLAGQPKAPQQAIVMKFFTSRGNTAAVMLLAENLYGKFLYSVMEGEDDKQPQQVAVSHFMLFNDTLIIRDTPEQAAAIARTLEQLEEATLGPAQDATRAALESTSEALVLHPFKPRFVPLAVAFNALEPLRRSVQDGWQPSGAQNIIENVHFVPDSDILVIRETRERLDPILKLLADVDRPATQATITCYVVRGGPPPAPGTVRHLARPGLPSDLVDNLAKLVPVNDLTLLSTNVVRGAVTSAITIEAEISDDLSYRINLQPAAFDDSTLELSLSQCQFRLRGVREQGFTTGASLRQGEYTVLGSVGQDPVFVVLRLSVDKR